jgi:hypothetical protein
VITVWSEVSAVSKLVSTLRIVSHCLAIADLPSNICCALTSLRGPLQCYRMHTLSGPIKVADSSVSHSWQIFGSSID